MKKNRILFIASTVYMGNDAFLPIPLILAHQGSALDVVFKTAYSYKAVMASSAWQNWLKEMARSIVLLEVLPNNKNIFKPSLLSKVMTKVIKLIYKIWLIFAPYDLIFAQAGCELTLWADKYRDNIYYFINRCPYDSKERLSILKSIDRLPNEQRKKLGKTKL